MNLRDQFYHLFGMLFSWIGSITLIAWAILGTALGFSVEELVSFAGKIFPLFFVIVLVVSTCVVRLCDDLDKELFGEEEERSHWH